MENITLGEIAKDLAFLSAFIGSVVYFKNMFTTNGKKQGRREKYNEKSMG